MTAAILLFRGLELMDLKAYGTFIVGWRLNYGTERNYTELFCFSGLLEWELAGSRFALRAEPLIEYRG